MQLSFGNDSKERHALMRRAPAGKSVYQVALADFLKAPDIKEVDVSKYNGQIGSTIRVRATDDFMVSQVWVAICIKDGNILEQGEAQRLANGVDWLYTATVNNTIMAGNKIVVRASDLPGNYKDSSLDL